MANTATTPKKRGRPPIIKDYANPLESPMARNSLAVQRQGAKVFAKPTMKVAGVPRARKHSSEQVQEQLGLEHPPVLSKKRRHTGVLLNTPVRQRAVSPPRSKGNHLVQDSPTKFTLKLIVSETGQAVITPESTPRTRSSAQQPVYTPTTPISQSKTIKMGSPGHSLDRLLLRTPTFDEHTLPHLDPRGKPRIQTLAALKSSRGDPLLLNSDSYTDVHTTLPPTYVLMRSPNRSTTAAATAALHSSICNTPPSFVNLGTAGGEFLFSPCTQGRTTSGNQFPPLASSETFIQRYKARRTSGHTVGPQTPQMRDEYLLQGTMSSISLTPYIQQAIEEENQARGGGQRTQRSCRGKTRICSPRCNRWTRR
ncbi:Msa1p KNAG_0L01910 [Huiozyma naganishii CBS 8797]|uniref:Uncharacterized protein n=1 Tax=Huiozyma naganishii (strain ATCC MYA-139 / BCRC 22969 / CBS 8797 / KCTC 17520 / NBRC 10181 / NCYC 3082 / Yp74L-3) TaxID=1071383 RepID=J7RD51_HUIN7|nr:hypothetical protein KNAG_0L01910 [Kazachstania naganishii CBS 8797]CCK72810.1 hypothetical protein KNAG_0L01910 [Kazachstania naganishii CBS 8797]